MNLLFFDCPVFLVVILASALSQLACDIGA
jgi:hypothetical protein